MLGVLDTINKSKPHDCKQLLDEVFAISGIIKVEVTVISRSRRLRLITLTETLIILDIAKTSSNNCLQSWGFDLFIVSRTPSIEKLIAYGLAKVHKFSE